MAQTLTRLLVHAVFSTKLRKDLIPESIEPRLHAYIGGICRSSGSALIAAGGTANHIHLLISMSKTISLAELMLEIKRDSSAWMKKQEPASEQFHWQDGYAGLSIGESQVEALKKYFAKQKQHHRTSSFENELRNLLRMYGVKHDERYVWD